MGNIERICEKLELPNPKGWDPKNDQFNLPFTVELKENFHIHWQDIRLEMMPSDFENFFHSIKNAYEQWIKDGKPQELNIMKRYGWWPGEENYDFIKDRDKMMNKNNLSCHHFRLFPRTESGNLFFDSIFQIELQKSGQYHIHYKNFRLELSRKRLEDMANTMINSVKNCD